MKYKTRHVVEYIALRSLAFILVVLPYRAALAVGWFVAAVAFFIFKFRVKAAKERINEVFGDRFTSRETNRIAWLSCRNIVFSSIETMRIGKIDMAWIARYSDCGHVMDTLKKHSDTGQGAVVAVPHMGAWEVAGLTSHLHGIPVFSIAAQQKNPLADQYLNMLRRSPGIETIARGSGTMRQVIRKLRDGKLLTILPDVRVRTEGVTIPFLGKPANLGAGMALFARHTGVPIFPCLVTRHGWTSHKIRIFEPVYPDKSLDKAEDVRRMTAHVIRIIEAAIRDDPAQWFWFNKRWVLDPL